MTETLPLLLLVDNDPDLRTLLAEILEARGYAVRAVVDGADALAALALEPRPVLVLLDLVMPRVNGLEFLVCRRGDAIVAAVPVLVLSAYSDLVALPVADTAGVFRKPLDLDALLAAIAAELRPVLPRGG